MLHLPIKGHAPTPQVQISLGGGTARPHSPTLHLDVVGAFEDKLIVCEYETQHIYDKIIIFMGIIVSFIQKGTYYLYTLSVWN